MKTLPLILLLATTSLVYAAPPPDTVPISAKKLIAYLESQITTPHDENIDQKIERIKQQMTLLDDVANTDSPAVWQYRHDKLEYLIGALYLETGKRQLAYRHLKTCIWNSGQYDRNARKLLEKHRKE